MSYSRWSNSRWYTFWCAGNKTDLREDQLFDVDCSFTFSYKELKQDMQVCLDLVIEGSVKSPTWEEVVELKGYMQEFLEDVADLNPRDEIWVETEFAKITKAEQAAIILRLGSIKEWYKVTLMKDKDEQDRL